MSNRGSYKLSQEADAYHARAQSHKSHVPPIVPAKKKHGSIVRFQFGKYKGRDIQEIRFKDMNYFDWAYKTVDRFRALVDSLDAQDTPVKRTNKPVNRSEVMSGLVVAEHNPNAVMAEGWTGNGPCRAVEDYKRRLALDPVLPYLLADELHLDRSFDPTEEFRDAPPW